MLFYIQFLINYGEFACTKVNDAKAPKHPPQTPHNTPKQMETKKRISNMIEKSFEETDSRIFLPIKMNLNIIARYLFALKLDFGTPHLFPDEKVREFSNLAEPVFSVLEHMPFIKRGSPHLFRQEIKKFNSRFDELLKCSKPKDEEFEKKLQEILKNLNEMIIYDEKNQELQLKNVESTFKKLEELEKKIKKTKKIEMIAKLEYFFEYKPISDYKTEFLDSLKMAAEIKPQRSEQDNSEKPSCFKRVKEIFRSKKR